MMVKKALTLLSIGLWVALGALTAPAQEPSGQPPVTGQQQPERTVVEEKAVALLEQLLAQSRSLRLPENRIRVQISAADLLWDRDQPQARALFAAAAAGLADLWQSPAGNDRQNFNQLRTPTQLRQELLLSVARHDAALAYQLLAATRPPTPPPEARNPRRPDAEVDLEQSLLAQIAALDPKLAARQAEELLDKGQYSGTLARVLAQLQRTDKEAAARLAEKTLKRLQSESLIANREASNLALTLLRAGPRPADAPAEGVPAVPNNTATRVLGEAAYRDLLETVVAAGLKATPGAAPGPRGPNFRGGQNNPRSQPTEAQAEQNNARGLLMGLQSLLPQIDQYLPARAAAVRQKLSETGIGNDPRLAFDQLNNLMQQGTAESLLSAAALAPPGMQSRLYQQAALKALEEGNADRARQIATEHLDPATREEVLHDIDFHQTSRATDASKLDEVRQTLSRLRSDEERVKLLLQLSDAARKNDPKLALQLLDEAQQMVGRRASSYQQLDAQLKVAHALAALDPARGFEALEPGINQLNELLPAAALLSGFEVNIFKAGELPLQGAGMLSSMVTRYGQELAVLAPSDFERARLTADKFQLPEARIIAQLALVRGLLGGEPPPTLAGGFGGRGFGPNGPLLRPPQ